MTMILLAFVPILAGLAGFLMRASFPFEEFLNYVEKSKLIERLVRNIMNIFAKRFLSIQKSFGNFKA